MSLQSTSEFDAAVEAFGSAIKHTKKPELLYSYRYAIKCHAKVLNVAILLTPIVSKNSKNVFQEHFYSLLHHRCMKDCRNNIGK